jgi:hypothetical protein
VVPELLDDEEPLFAFEPVPVLEDSELDLTDEVASCAAALTTDLTTGITRLSLGCLVLFTPDLTLD